MKLYAAGGGQHQGKDYGTYCAEQGVHKLYTINGEMKYIHAYTHPYKLLVDSGGHIFNATEGGINQVGFGKKKPPPNAYEYMDYYMSCVERLKDRDVVIFELDIYGHLPKYLIDGMYREISTIKGRFKHVRVYHPEGIDKDYSLKTLKKWIAQGQDYIAISKSSKECYPEIFKLTGNQVRLHGLALTSLDILTKYPFYSCDSTNALVTPFKTGKILLDIDQPVSFRQLLEEKSVNYLTYSGLNNTLIQSIAMFKKLETYVTRLWQKRGVEWK